MTMGPDPSNIILRKSVRRGIGATLSNKSGLFYKESEPGTIALRQGFWKLLRNDGKRSSKCKQFKTFSVIYPNQLFDRQQQQTYNSFILYDNNRNG